MVDNGRCAGVRGAHDRALELERAHLRELQVLVLHERSAEPGQVADVGEDRRRRRADDTGDDVLAEQVLVADQRPHALAADLERRAARAACLVAERDLEHVDEPAKAGRNELAERQQVALAVEILAPRTADADDRIDVPVLRIAGEQADQQAALVCFERMREPRPDHRGDLGARERNHRLGRDDERAARGLDLAHEGVQVGIHARRIEFQILRDSRLQQANAEHACRLREAARQPEPGRQQQQRNREQGGPRRARHGARQRRHGEGQPRGKRRDAVHAGPGRPGCERPDAVRIARGDPRKTGEERRPRQLGEQPAGGKAQCVAERSAAAQPRPERERASVVQRQRRGQREHGERREPGRHAAIGVHADVEPPQPRDQPAGAEQPAEQRGARRPRFACCMCQHGQGRDLQPPGLERREREGLCHPGQQRGGRPEGGAHQAA